MLPSSTIQFFLKILHEAIKNPTAETLKPVYLCLKGACQGVFSYLSRETRNAIDEELRRILKTTSKLEQSSLKLFCMGTVIFSEPTNSGKRQWKTRSGQLIFGSPEDQARTILLATLSIVGVLKSKVESSVSDVMEECRAATRTILCIEPSVRHGWLASDKSKENHYKHSLSKLERDARSAISPCIRLEVGG